MIDLHCHILPNMDDGASSLEEALAMARFYAEDGITHAVATPHCHRFTHLLRADILPRVAAFNADLAAAGIPLTVLPGSEIQVIVTAEYRREFDEGLFCHLGDGTEFTLLEFNWSVEQFPPDAPELVAWIRSHGMTPIIAHPERYPYFWDRPELLRPIVEAGAWVQVTVDSLQGSHGPAPCAAGEAILRQYPDAVLATDAHNRVRCSGLSVGYDWVREVLGDDRADDLIRRADAIRASLQRS